MVNRSDLPVFVPLPVPSRIEDLPAWDARQWQALAQYLTALHAVIQGLVDGAGR